MKSPSSVFESAPALRVGIATIAGALVGRFVPTAPSGVEPLYVLLTGATFAFILLYVFKPQRSAIIWCGFLVCFLMGTAKFLLDRDRLPRDILSARHLPVILGTVVDDPEQSETRMRFLLRANNVIADSLVYAFPTDVIVTLIPQARDSLMPGIAYGMNVAIRGTLERPSDERNPGEFSTRAYYEANGITHELTARGVKSVAITGRECGSWWMRLIVFPIRRWMLATFDSTTRGEEGEFLKGLILGERGGMSAMTKEAFVNAGVAHVLAVSGSNVAVVAAVLYLLLELLRVPRTIRLYPVLGGLIFYMLVTGSQPSVVRATIMAGVILAGKLIQRPVNAWNCLGVSALVIVAIDARQVFDIGFQLSYGAVLSLMALYPVMNGWINAIPSSSLYCRGFAWVLRVCAVSLAATLGTVPLTAACFGRVSVIGILANIVVIPATELSVLLGAASLGAALLGEWIAQAYGALNWFVLHWTLVLTRLAGFSSVAYIDTVTFGSLDALPYYGILALVFGGAKRKFQYILIAVLSSVVFEGFVRPALVMGSDPACLRVSLIDVGQGDAVLVEFPDKTTLLVDTGPRSPEFDSGEKTVLPFLRRRGIRTLDLLVITHTHADHVGGYASVANGVAVRRVLAISPTAVRRTLGALWPKAEPHIDSCASGQIIDLSRSARVYIMYPLPGVEIGHLGGNESIVLKVAYGSTSFLFTGDAEAQEEQSMIGRYGKFLGSTFLKAAHHGSRTSSTDRFLTVVEPKYVGISVGKHNKFRHPSPSVIQRLNDLDIDVSRTDDEGALVFETNGNSIWKSHWR